MHTMLIIFIISACAVVKADLILKPTDTEAVIGDSTYFDCASNVDTNEVNWYHYAVGVKDHEDICLYCLGRIHPQYKNRIDVDRNFTTGNYRLRIKTVQQQDAGRYICQDNGGIGKSTSAQLVILESIPACTSNMKPDGVLGPNDCGLEPDTLHLSCQVSYHGNIPPVIKWREAETRDPVKSTFCQNIDNRITCNLSMTAVLGLNGASYICETNRSKTSQYNCVSDIIRLLYVKTDNSTKEMAQGAEDKVFCSVNSSQSCFYTWKWFDGVHEETAVNGPALVTHKPGWYRCESKCVIRGKECTVLSNLVHVSEQPMNDIHVDLIIGLIMVTMVAVFFCVGSICMVVIFRKGKQKMAVEKTQIRRTLIDVEEQTTGVSTITTKKEECV